METTAAPTAVHDDRGTFVVIGGSPYVAYAIYGGPAYLTRITRHAGGSITLHPVGEPHARLDLAADAGRWRADREAYAATAEHECARCGTPSSWSTRRGCPSTICRPRAGSATAHRTGRRPHAQPPAAQARTLITSRRQWVSIAAAYCGSCRRRAAIRALTSPTISAPCASRSARRRR